MRDKIDSKSKKKKKRNSMLPNYFVLFTTSGFQSVMF